MTFHFEQVDDGSLRGIAILDANELANLRPCPQCDQKSLTYGHVDHAYFIECPRCGLRDPRSIRTLRNAMRYHKRALTDAVKRWNDRANDKGGAPWPKPKSTHGK